ncbi:MAG: hypothetical protein ACREWG_16510 [Gammaproteobacteria bacterium]
MKILRFALAGAVLGALQVALVMLVDRGLVMRASGVSFAQLLAVPPLQLFSEVMQLPRYAALGAAVGALFGAIGGLLTSRRRPDPPRRTESARAAAVDTDDGWDAVDVLRSRERQRAEAYLSQRQRRDTE